MRALIDTNIAIHLRDRDPVTIARFAELDAPPALSIVTQVELEGGIVARPEFAGRRRKALDAMLAAFDVLPFDAAAAAAYRAILEGSGYSRPGILDRMIAATALVHGLQLITRNRRDFEGIARLDLQCW